MGRLTLLHDCRSSDLGVHAARARPVGPYDPDPCTICSFFAQNCIKKNLICFFRTTFVLIVFLMLRAVPSLCRPAPPPTCPTTGHPRRNLDTKPLPDTHDET